MRFPLGALFLIIHNNGYARTSLFVAVCLCLSDWLDGYLARRWDCTSEFGARIEPWADKVAYWAIIWAGLTIMPIPALMYPVIAVLALHELVQVILVCLVRRIKTNRYAKRRVASIMVMSIALLSTHTVPYAQGLFLVTAHVAGYASLYFALRSMIVGMRDVGWGNYVPRPLDLL